MPISQTTITGSVKTPANRDAAITEVTFKLVGSDYEDGEIIAENTVAATTIEADGDFEVTLWPNDAGMEGNTTYEMAFKFKDGSSVPGLKKVFVRASDTPKTIEDVAFETKVAGAIKPYNFQVITQAQYDQLSAKAPNTVYLVRG